MRTFLRRVWLCLELPANLWTLIFTCGVARAALRIIVLPSSRKRFMEAYRGTVRGDN